MTWCCSSRRRNPLPWPFCPSPASACWPAAAAPRSEKEKTAEGDGPVAAPAARCFAPRGRGVFVFRLASAGARPESRTNPLEIPLLFDERGEGVGIVDGARNGGGAEEQF